MLINNSSHLQNKFVSTKTIVHVKLTNCIFIIVDFQASVNIHVIGFIALIMT